MIAKISAPVGEPAVHQKTQWLLLILILLLGLSVRLWIAPTVENGDAVITQQWMKGAVQLGLAASYDHNVDGGILPAYPPFSILLFQAAGLAYQALISPQYELLQPQHLVFVKLPGMLADMGICIFLYLLLASWKKPLTGLIVALAFALHPAVLYNSTIWGQTDVIYTLLILASFFFLSRKFSEVGLLFLTLACLTKPQAIAFVPLALILLPKSPRRIFFAAITSLIAVAVLLLPFVIEGNLPSVVRVYHVLNAFGETRVSWNAYNLWWLFFGVASNQTPGTSELFGWISYRSIGLLLWGATYIFTILVSPVFAKNLMKRDQGILLAITLIAWSFFLLNAEMHERYLYPFLAFALPLAAIDRRWLMIYILISIAYLLNLLAVFPYSALDSWLFSRITNLHVFLSALQLLLFAGASFFSLSDWMHGKPFRVSG